MTTQQPHRPDTDPEEMTIRVPRGAVSGIRKQYVRMAMALLVLVVAVALVVGLGIDFRPRSIERDLDVTPRESRPAELSNLPGSYADLPHPRNPSENSSPQSASGHGENDPSDALWQQNEELRRNLSSMMAAIEQIDGQNKRLLGQIARYEDEAFKEQAKVWQAGLYFKRDADQPYDRNEDGHATSGDRPSPYPVTWPPVETIANPTRDGSKEQRSFTDQQRKLAFLNGTAASGVTGSSGGNGVHLDKPYLHPRSPYEVQAGTVIPAALLTGINTDLPGDVLAVVTEPIYDSRTGKHLLVPQGAKLYGSYDSEISNGQNRALLVWHRLLMPNGRSIQLDRMRGTDAAGYAGVADRVDYHLKKVATGAALSTVIAYAGNLARGDSRGGGDDARDVIGDTVAQEATRVGSRIIDRQLDVQPTITIRPGWPLRVLVNQDMLLAPYTD